MTSKKHQNISDLLDVTLDALKQAGADHASAFYKQTESRSVKIRNGQVDGINRSDATKLWMKGWVGDKHNATEFAFDAGTVGTANFDRAAIDDAAAQIVAAARQATGNEFCQPAEAERFSKIRHNKRLDLYDPTRPDDSGMVDRARAAEAAALSTPKIAISQGASASWLKMFAAHRTSNGFDATTLETSHGVGVSAIARHNGDEQSGGEGYTTAHLSDLKDPALLGRLAAEEAVSALNPRPAKAGAYPVILSPDVARGLLNAFASAADGKAMRLKKSFLAAAVGKQIAPRSITILNNPHLKRGPNSAMYTGECLPARKTALVENGIFTAMLLTMEEARRLKLEDTAVIQPAYNLSIEPSAKPPSTLFAEAGEGFYVTGLQGHGTDTVSGDFSHGASGFWFENGVITHAVNGATIAGNLTEMFATMEAANDLDRYKSSLGAPTLRIGRMTIA